MDIIEYSQIYFKEAKGDKTKASDLIKKETYYNKIIFKHKKEVIEFLKNKYPEEFV